MEQVMIYACKDCQDRHEGCHSTCERYQRDKAIHEQEKAKLDKLKAEQTDANNYTYEKVMRLFTKRRG